MKATILLAEDERDMREVLCDYFTAKSGGELTMISAPDGNTALHLIETQPFDLLLLDIMLPGTDGFALCRAAREQGDAPVLFVTAREDEQDKLYGYDQGADDYVVKPFSLAVLYAKAQALLRRSRGMTAAEVLRAGALELNPARGTVTAMEAASCTGWLCGCMAAEGSRRRMRRMCYRKQCCPRSTCLPPPRSKPQLLPRKRRVTV